jgi:hypothetical protein
MERDEEGTVQWLYCDCTVPVLEYCYCSYMQKWEHPRPFRWWQSVYREVSKHVTRPSLYAMTLVGIATGCWLFESSEAEKLQERAAASIYTAAELLQSP